MSAAIPTRFVRVPNPRGPTVRAGPFAGVGKLLQELGCELDPVLAQAGLGATALSNPDGLLDYHRAGALLAGAAAASGCSHLGLLLGQRVSALQLGISGFMVRAAANVGHALQTLVENLDLHDTGSVIAYEVRPDLVRVEYRIDTPDAAAREQGYDFTMAVLCSLLRNFCGPDWTPMEVQLPRPRPAKESPYHDYFRCSVSFECDACVLLFSSHYLGHALATADTLLYHRLEEEAALRHRFNGAQLIQFLPQLLRKGLWVDRYSAGALSHSLGIHERTLHRRLQAAGTTYRAQLDRVRHAVSRELLAGTNLRISDIAQSVGYADSPSFIRAFKRWSGVSPMTWRRQSISSSSGSEASAEAAQGSR